MDALFFCIIIIIAECEFPVGFYILLDFRFKVMEFFYVSSVFFGIRVLCDRQELAGSFDCMWHVWGIVSWRAFNLSVLLGCDWEGVTDIL